MTAVQRAAMDINEDAKGVPVHLTPYVFFFAVFLFSVPHYLYRVIFRLSNLKDHSQNLMLFESFV